MSFTASIKSFAADAPFPMLTLVCFAPSLYFGPAETFANKGVMVNADGDLCVIPATNGMELMVLVVHGDAAPASAAD